MVKIFLLSSLISLLLSVVIGKLTLPLLRKIKIGQPILKYVEEHKEKKGTPTMGGIFFIVPCAICYLIFFGVKKHLALVALVIGVAFMLVGFIDDFLKVHFHKNEGLKPLQKILFQSGIAVVAGIFCYYNGLTKIYIPFTKSQIDFGFFIIPIAVFIFIAIVNCVNLTDGLDGLAGSVSLVYFICITLLISLQLKFSNSYMMIEEGEGFVGLSCCLIGGLSGFLVFNINKAKVFMGDTGSLSLGGFIGAISIFSGNSFYIPIIGIMFVISGISVILQVLYYKKSKKRIFLMAPLHHHYQQKGFSETQIAYYYSLITCIMGIVSLIFYL